jgi:sarcosine oxidase subunit beta
MSNENVYEVVVVGGGAIGTSTAFWLAASGVKVCLLEGRNLAFGSTGKSLALVRQHYSFPTLAQLAFDSIRIFNHFYEIVGGSAGYIKTGFVLIGGRDHEEWLKKNVAMQQSLGISTSLVDSTFLKGLLPTANCEDISIACYEPEGGYVDPIEMTCSFARFVKRTSGSSLVFDEVSMIQVKEKRVQCVITKTGQHIYADKFVVASGPWTQKLAERMGWALPLELRFTRCFSFRIPDWIELTIPVTKDLIHDFYVRSDSSMNLVGGYGVDRVPSIQPDSYEEGVTNKEISELFTRMKKRFPTAEAAVFRGGWTGITNHTPDGQAIVDKIPGVDNGYLAVGFSGHGLKIAPAVGREIANLVNDKTPTVDMTMFSLKRFENTGDETYNWLEHKEIRY